MGKQPRPEAVLIARRRFFEEGTLPDDLLAPPVLRSWVRCAEIGLDTAAAPRLEPMTMRELRQAQEGNALLMRFSRPEIEALRDEATASGSILILTDAQGLILATLGSSEFAGRAAGVSLRPGVPWREAATGTNAIGAALVEKRPVEVRGPEHYFEAHQRISCWATPILDPSGRVAGVLDLSAPAAADHTHAMGLIRLAADQIEHRFFEQGFEQCEVLRFHNDGALLGSAAEGIFAFSGDRLVAANRAGLRLLGLSWSALNTRGAASLFETRLAELTHQGRVRGHNGAEYEARIERRAAARVSTGRPESRMRSFLDEATLEKVAQAARLIDARVPFLIHGELGTGKEVFARAAHARSSQGDGSFVAVRCAPGVDIASLLPKEGGVVFLDGVDDLDQAAQASLVAALNGCEAAADSVPRQVSLIGACRGVPAEKVNDGTLRRDLYFQLAEFVIELPALRALPDRRAWVRGLWDALSAGARTIDPACEQALTRYDWPGNLRQLAGTLRGLIAIAEPGRPVTVDLLPPDVRAAADSSTTSTKGQLDEVVLNAMRQALRGAHGNVSKAACALGVSRSTFYRRLRATASAEAERG